MKRALFEVIRKNLIPGFCCYLASTIFCLSAAYIYNISVDPVYTVQALLKLEETQNDVNALTGITLTRSYSSRTLSEGHIITSKTLIRRAVKALDYPVIYYENKLFGRREIVAPNTFEIRILKQKSNFYKGEIHVHLKADNSFVLTYHDENKTVSRHWEKTTLIYLPGVLFELRPRQHLILSQDYYFRFTSVDELSQRIGNSLAVNETAKFSPVSIATLSDHNPIFAAHALNAILNEYIRYDYTQKKEISKAIARAIDAKIIDVSGQLKKAGKQSLNYQKREATKDPFLKPSQANDADFQQLDRLEHAYVVNQHVLDFLVERKLQSEIGQAALVPGAILIDPAESDSASRYPAPSSVWRSALLLSILIGFASNYLRRKPYLWRSFYAV